MTLFCHLSRVCCQGFSWASGIYSFQTQTVRNWTFISALVIFFVVSERKKSLSILTTRRDSGLYFLDWGECIISRRITSIFKVLTPLLKQIHLPGEGRLKKRQCWCQWVDWDTNCFQIGQLLHMLVIYLTCPISSKLLWQNLPHIYILRKLLEWLYSVFRLGSSGQHLSTQRPLGWACKLTWRLWTREAGELILSHHLRSPEDSVASLEGPRTQEKSGQYVCTQACGGGWPD